MHIPDGYLSPETCAALYAAATPFWFVSLKRAKRTLRTRTAPLISLFAAFAFVVMMFNVPLPGGTTGHALGVTIAAIVLGPWNAILAVSVALAIQAIFFADGGITALGANGFNMAIAGSFVAYGVYRLFAGRSESSRRKVVGAAIAGYLAINVAALLTSIELGIQPLLFRDATGAPLYAPYRLGIAIPVMMLGHLTVAGLAEAALSTGVVSFLLRVNPELLMEAVPGTDTAEGVVDETSQSTATSRPLWAVLGLMLLLTPLGVLAVGSAWGEWSARDFQDPASRKEMTAVSNGQAPPVQVPRGLERMSSFWTAPFPGYAPKMIRNHTLGYFLSAMFGAGLAILATVAGFRIAYVRKRASLRQ
jgi:cobalt/nickel transport system permease protein